MPGGNTQDLTLASHVFAKGYIEVNGVSLRVAEAERSAGWLEVWLIPEILHMTTSATSARAMRCT